MGMYDTLQIAPDLLPVSSDDRKKNEKEKIEWQTKDLDNCLSNLEITHGRLTETINDVTADLDYHGIIEFHSNVGKQWYSFLAKFTDGNLAGIVQINDKIKNNWPPISLNRYFKNEKTDNK